MTTNNAGHLLDSGGNIAIDFAWGPFPTQPNDERADGTPAYKATGGTAGTAQLSYKTAVVTGASNNGGTVTYVAANTFNAGEIVTITGLSTSAFNLTGVTIATASPTGFTVTNAATGSTVTGATALAKVVIGSIPGVGADYGWRTTTDIDSARLDYDLDNHVIAETGYSGFPALSVPKATAMVTAASGNGTTVSYTAQNNFVAGQTISVTGLTTNAFNLSSVTIATANATGFTVTNSATGTAVTGASGKAFDPTDVTDGSYVGGVVYLNVPNVIGLTVASAVDALKDAGYAAGNITTASASTPAVSSIELTDDVATLLTSAAHGYSVGDSVVIAGLDDVTTDLYSEVNGTHVLAEGTTGSTLVFDFTHADLPLNSTTAVVGATAKVLAKAGLIKTQSVAAGTASVAEGSSITITPYFAS